MPRKHTAVRKIPTDVRGGADIRTGARTRPKSRPTKVRTRSAQRVRRPRGRTRPPTRNPDVRTAARSRQKSRLANIRAIAHGSQRARHLRVRTLRVPRRIKHELATNKNTNGNGSMTTPAQPPTKNSKRPEAATAPDTSLTIQVATPTSRTRGTHRPLRIPAAHLQALAWKALKPVSTEFIKGFSYKAGGVAGIVSCAYIIACVLGMNHINAVRGMLGI